MIPVIFHSFFFYLFFKVRCACVFATAYSQLLRFACVLLCTIHALLAKLLVGHLWCCQAVNMSKGGRVAF